MKDHWSWDPEIRAAIRRRCGLKRFRRWARLFARRRARDRKRYIRQQGAVDRTTDDRTWRIVVRNKQYRWAYSR